MNIAISAEYASEMLKFSQKLLDGIPFSEIYNDELFRNQNVFLFWKGWNGNYLACNENFSLLSGMLHPQHIVGRNDHDLPWTKDQTEKFIADDQAVANLACPKINIIETVLQADGKENKNITSKFPIFSSNRKEHGVFCIMANIIDDELLEQKAIKLLGTN